MHQDLNIVSRELGCKEDDAGIKERPQFWTINPLDSRVESVLTSRPPTPHEGGKYKYQAR